MQAFFDADVSVEGIGIEERLHLFDAATARQQAREAERGTRRVGTRGWTREDLYEPGPPDTD